MLSPAWADLDAATAQVDRLQLELDAAQTVSNDALMGALIDELARATSSRDTLIWRIAQQIANIPTVRDKTIAA